jgi:hypothetical protein
MESASPPFDLFDDDAAPLAPIEPGQHDEYLATSITAGAKQVFKHCNGVDALTNDFRVAGGQHVIGNESNAPDFCKFLDAAIAERCEQRSRAAVTMHDMFAMNNLPQPQDVTMTEMSSRLVTLPSLQLTTFLDEIRRLRGEVDPKPAAKAVRDRLRGFIAEIDKKMMDQTSRLDWFDTSARHARTLELRLNRIAGDGPV